MDQIKSVMVSRCDGLLCLCALLLAIIAHLLVRLSVKREMFELNPAVLGAGKNMIVSDNEGNLSVVQGTDMASEMHRLGEEVKKQLTKQTEDLAAQIDNIQSQIKSLSTRIDQKQPIGDYLANNTVVMLQNNGAGCRSLLRKKDDKGLTLGHSKSCGDAGGDAGYVDGQKWLLRRY